MAPGEQPRIVAAGRLVSGRLETPRTNEALDSSVVKPKNLVKGHTAPTFETNLAT